MAMTWIPHDNLRVLVAQMHLRDLQSSVLAVDTIIHRPEQAMPILVQLWSDHSRALVRYGLNLIREIEERGYIPEAMVTLRKILSKLLVREAEFVKPTWWTPELCASHRSVMKYLDIRRTLRKRVKKVTSSPDEWCDDHGLPRFTKMTQSQVDLAHKTLDGERAPETWPFYQHFTEEPTGELVWPSSLLETFQSDSSVSHTEMCSEESTQPRQPESIGPELS